MLFLSVMFKVSHKKSYFIGVEFTNFQILRNIYFDIFSMCKAETANWAETAA